MSTLPALLAQRERRERPSLGQRVGVARVVVALLSQGH